MNNKRVNLILVPLSLAVIIFYFLRGCDRRIDRNTGSKTLAPGVVEKVIIDPGSHKLTIATPTGVETLFLPDRPSSIEIRKGEKAVVTSRQYGTELRPFIGFQYSNKGRLAAGVDVVYFKRLDLGVGLAGEISKQAPVGLMKLSYTVWSNTQVGITYDTGNRVGGAVTVRF